MFVVPEPVQLLRFGLFPGTWLRPSTVYTINGLRDYHLLSLQCQITGYLRYKGRVSGIVGISCARHMFVLPCATVDIIGGKRFAYPDYCMCAGLHPWKRLPRHHREYDIDCQYTVHIRDCLIDILKRYPNLSTIQDAHFPWTLVGIGKFHVSAHQESCRSKYSYYYIPGSGMTDREAL
ncbi:hypothetical protein BD309DRAFT_1068674 [Dichomitus squalens]|nr:hypothetical protein BD309DRAFT_1068674 [Dichomitus squalens]